MTKVVPSRNSDKSLNQPKSLSCRIPQRPDDQQVPLDQVRGAGIEAEGARGTQPRHRVLRGDEVRLLPQPGRRSSPGQPRDREAPDRPEPERDCSDAGQAHEGLVQFLGSPQQ